MKINKEIKEILDYLNNFINDREEITKYGCEISVKQAKLLLDYITNLQEKYEEADNDRHKLVEQKEKVIKKIEGIMIFGLRSGKTLIATLLNEILDILQGSDEKWTKE